MHHKGRPNKKIKTLLLIVLLLCYGSLFSQIAVSPSKNHLTKDGQPFFWLADTGWELFHRLSREEAIHYLNTRQQQGFNVVMAVALAELDGIHTPNYYGDIPFSDVKTLTWAETPGNNAKDPLAYGYWDHVDFVVREAAKRNIFIGLLPAWGDKVVPGAAGPVIFTDSISSYNYARRLANRYKSQKNVIWILGGDRPAVDQRNSKDIRDYRPIWRSMARAIRDVYGNNVFLAYHPNWFTGEYFGAEDDWLSMTAMQSGHGSREVKVWDWVRSGLKMTPQRPFMDMEPCYEDHPVSPWDGKWTRAGRGYFNDYDVRARIYRGIFAGGCGAVYGHHQVWQFVDTSRYQPVFTGDTLIGWQQAMLAKAAIQMKHLKKLMSLHADFDREEDSLLIASHRGSNYKDMVIATRNKNRSYAMVYLPEPDSISVNLDRLNKGAKKISWFNPATGSISILPQQYKNGIVAFKPPGYIQKDWVLIIDAVK